MTDQKLKEMKEAYTAIAMDLLRVRTFANRAYDRLTELGELIEQEEAKNAESRKAD